VTKWPNTTNNELTSFGGLSRSELMSRIRSSGNESTELKMRKLLRKNCLKGWRRNSSLTGKPDFVWHSQKLALFVDGCFWHGHNCGRNLKPKSNVEAWSSKIARNRKRDSHVTRQLKAQHWKVVRIWECSLIRSPGMCARRILDALQR